jgi:hypothetical protein
VLDLHSWLSDNIAANFIGLGLGTLFRFWSYRKFVFKEEIELDEVEDSERQTIGHTPTPDSPARLDTESTGDLPAVR